MTDRSAVDEDINGWRDHFVDLRLVDVLGQLDRFGFRSGTTAVQVIDDGEFLFGLFVVSLRQIDAVADIGFEGGRFERRVLQAGRVGLFEFVDPFEGCGSGFFFGVSLFCASAEIVRASRSSESEQVERKAFIIRPRNFRNMSVWIGNLSIGHGIHERLKRPIEIYLSSPLYLMTQSFKKQRGARRSQDKMTSRRVRCADRSEVSRKSLFSHSCH